MEKFIFENCIGFEWDEGNRSKNVEKHNVSNAEVEETFFNLPLLIYDDLKHSINEKRRYLLGRTDNDRRLSITFTTRKRLIRVISARDMGKKERNIYEKA